MSVMEFILVALSIIIGLGIAEILRGIADLVRARVASLSWLTLGVAAWTFLHLVQLWWSMWRIRDMETWSFAAFLLMLAPLSLLYIVARMSLPQELEDADLEAYYVRVSPTIWILVGSIYLIFPIGGLLLLRWPITSLVSVSQIGLAVLALVTSRSRPGWLHALSIGVLIVHTTWRGAVVALGS